jgi:hypothetical protein
VVEIGTNVICSNSPAHNFNSPKCQVLMVASLVAWLLRPPERGEKGPADSLSAVCVSTYRKYGVQCAPVCRG